MSYSGLLSNITFFPFMPSKAWLGWSLAWDRSLPRKRLRLSMRKKNFYDIMYHKTSMRKKMYDRFISGFEEKQVWHHCGQDKLEEGTGKPVGMFLWQAIEGENLHGRKEKQTIQTIQKDQDRDGLQSVYGFIRFHRGCRVKMIAVFPL